MKKILDLNSSNTLLFNNDLDKFKFETQIKISKNIVDEKQVGITEAKKLFHHWKLLVSEVLKLVKLILLVPTINAVSERSRSTLCNVYIVDLFFNLDFVLNYVASNGLEIALFWKILPPQYQRACGRPENKWNIFSVQIKSNCIARFTTAWKTVSVKKEVQFFKKDK